MLPLVLCCVAALLLGLVSSGRAEEPAAPGPTARTLRVVTLNVWGVPGARDLEARLERLPDALKSLDADVLCLQEVWLQSWRRRIAEALAPAYEAADAEGGGLLVLSRLPLRDAVFTRFPELEGLSLVERLARKGWLTVVVRTPAGEVRVCTTHLAHRGPAAQQLDVLRNELLKTAAMPQVLAGDLNLAPDDDALDVFARSGWRTARAPRAREDGSLDLGPPTRVGWPRRSGSELRGWRPDQVWLRGLDVRSHAVALTTPETAVSDHNAVVVDVLIPLVPPADAPR